MMEKQGFNMRRQQGGLLIIKAHLMFNNLDKMTECLEEANRLFQDELPIFFKQHIITYGTPYSLYLYHNEAGKLLEKVEKEKAFVRYYMKLILHIDGGWDELIDAEYAYAVGDFEKSLMLAELVLEKAKFRKQICIIISSYYIKMNCLIYFGKTKELEETLEEFRNLEGIERLIIKNDYDLTFGSAMIRIKQADKLPAWLKQFELENCNQFVRRVRSACIVYGGYLICKKQWVRLDAIAEQMQIPYSNTVHVYACISGYIFKAVAMKHIHGAEAALAWLEKGLKIAEPDNIRAPFIANAAELYELCECLADESPFCEGLLGQMKFYIKNAAKFHVKSDKVLLTKREEEIIHLVCNGYRNTQISEKMNIALVTVEKRLTTIYRKLGVTNRTLAAAKWNELQKSGII